MANVNDSGGLSGRLENAISNIETADIDEADREAIHEYAHWKRRRAGSMNTARLYIRGVTLSAERYDGKLVEVESATEADRIIDAHEDAGCTAAKSINTKLCGLRDFWRWCESTEYGLDDYRWVDLVKNVSPSDENPGVEPLDPEFILSEEEIIALREVADHNRDKALIEFLADTGARITLATQLKRGSINLDRNPPTFRPNPEGVGHKGVATKEYVLKEAARHIRLYLKESHPDDHDEAPLFTLLRGYDPEDRENGALAARSARERLTTAAEAAGIDPERAHPHNLRKSAVVRMKLKHEMNWDAIQKRMEWSDTALPKMKEVYRAITNEDEIEMVARQLGYGSGSDEGDSAGGEAGSEIECWNCGTEASAGDSFCRQCGMDPSGDDQSQAAWEQIRSQTGETITLDGEAAGVLLGALGIEDDGRSITLALPPDSEAPASSGD